MRGAYVFLLSVCVFFALYCVNGEQLDENYYRTGGFLTKRAKRQQQQQQQQPEDIAEQFFDRIFGIPINTLNSVNDLVKSTIPMFRRARDRIQQLQQQQNAGGSGGSRRPSSAVSGNHPRPSLRFDD